MSTRAGDVEAVPKWVTEGYGQDVAGRAIAEARWRTPNLCSSPEERAAVARARGTPAPTTYACSVCNRHAFSKPTVCYWCGKQHGAGVAEHGEHALTLEL